MARLKGWNETIQEANDNYYLVFDYDGNNNPIYIGKAVIGSSTADPVWQIRNLTFSGSNVTAIKWANGDDAYNSIWDNRASLSYL